jgi:microcin C transport system substrate-binding protein
VPTAGEVALLEPFRDQLPPEVFKISFRPPRTDGSGDWGIRYHLRRAMAQLDASGWVVQGGRLVDGKTGAPFAFDILLHDQSDARLVLPFARVLKRLGIDVTVHAPGDAAYRARRDRFDFDMILDDWEMPALPTGEPRACWGSATADSAGSCNYPGIKSPVVDALTVEMADAKDPAQRLDAAHALDRVLTRGYYVIPLYSLAGQ